MQFHLSLLKGGCFPEPSHGVWENSHIHHNAVPTRQDMVKSTAYLTSTLRGSPANVWVQGGLQVDRHPSAASVKHTSKAEPKEGK